MSGKFISRSAIQNIYCVPPDLMQKLGEPDKVLYWKGKWRVKAYLYDVDRVNQFLHENKGVIEAYKEQTGCTPKTYKHAVLIN